MESGYDGAMRLAVARCPRDTSSNPVGSDFAYAYDADGNPTYMLETAYGTENTQYLTSRAYDALDRMISYSVDDADAETADARTTTFAYDSLNQCVDNTDPLGNTTAIVYDFLGRVTDEKHDAGEADEAVVSHAYDANGRVTSLTDPKGNETSFEYDLAGRVTAEVRMDGSRETYAYNGVGDLVESVSATGLVTSVAYDVCGRPVAREYASLGGRREAGPESFSYDGLGRVTSAENPSSRVEYGYDTLGNVVLERSYPSGGPSEGLVTRCGYNAKGLRDQVTYPSGKAFDFGHDLAGRMTSAAYGPLALARYGWQGGRQVSRTLLPGVSSAYSYDVTGGDVTSVRHEDGSSATLEDRSYTWDRAGNLAVQTVTAANYASETAFGYDGLNRLTSMDVMSGSWPEVDATWPLDAAGNRTESAYTLSGVNGSMNRYSATPYWGACYYDLSGSLSVSVPRTGVNSGFYYYDARGRLVEAVRLAMNFASGTPVSLDPAGALLLPASPSQWSYASGVATKTGDESARLLVNPSASRYAMMLEYKSAHDPDDPNGDWNNFGPEFSTEDYRSKYYGEFVLSCYTGGGAPYPFLALAIRPDEVALVGFDGSDTMEYAHVPLLCEAETWYRAVATVSGTTVRVFCGLSSGDGGFATLSAEVPQLILILFQVETNYPRPSRQAP